MGVLAGIGLPAKLGARFTRCLHLSLRAWPSKRASYSTASWSERGSSGINFASIEKYKSERAKKTPSGAASDPTPLSRSLWSEMQWPLQRPYSPELRPDCMEQFKKKHEHSIAAFKRIKDLPENAQLSDISSLLYKMGDKGERVLDITPDDLFPLLHEAVIRLPYQSASVASKPQKVSELIVLFVDAFESLFTAVSKMSDLPSQSGALVSKQRRLWIFKQYNLPLLLQLLQADLDEPMTLLKRYVLLFERQFPRALNELPMVSFSRIALADALQKLGQAPDLARKLFSVAADRVILEYGVAHDKLTVDILQRVLLATYCYGRSQDLDHCFTLFHNWYPVKVKEFRDLLARTYINALLNNMSISGALRAAEMCHKASSGLVYHLDILKYLNLNRDITHMISVYDSLVSRQILITREVLGLLLDAALEKRYSAFAVELLEYGVSHNVNLDWKLANRALYCCVERGKHSVAVNILQRADSLELLDMDLVELLLESVVQHEDHESLRNMVNVLLNCFKQQIVTKKPAPHMLQSMAKALCERSLTSLLKSTTDLGVMLASLLWCEKLNICLPDEVVSQCVDLYVVSLKSLPEMESDLQGTACNWDGILVLYRLTFGRAELTARLKGNILRHMSLSSAEKSPSPAVIKSFVDSLQSVSDGSYNGSMIDFSKRLLYAKGWNTSSNIALSQKAHTGLGREGQILEGADESRVNSSSETREQLTAALNAAIESEQRYLALSHYDKFRHLGIQPHWQSLVRMIQFLGAKCPTRNDYGSALQIFDFLIETYTPLLSSSESARRCLTEAFQAAAFASLANDDFPNFKKLLADHQRLLATSMPLATILDSLGANVSWTAGQILYMLSQVELSSRVPADKRLYYLSNAYSRLLDCCLLVDQSSQREVALKIERAMVNGGCPKTAAHYLPLIKLTGDKKLFEEYLATKPAGPASASDMELLCHVMSEALDDGQSAKEVKQLVHLITSPKMGVQLDEKLLSLVILGLGRVVGDMASAEKLLKAGRDTKASGVSAYCAVMESYLHWALSGRSRVLLPNETSTYLRETVLLNGCQNFSRVYLLSCVLKTFRQMFVEDELPISQWALELVVEADGMIGYPDRAAQFRTDSIRKHNLESTIRIENALIRAYISRNRIPSALAVFEQLAEPSSGDDTPGKAAKVPVRNKESWQLILEGVRWYYSHAGLGRQGVNHEHAQGVAKPGTSQVTQGQLLKKFDLNYIQKAMAQEC